MTEGVQEPYYYQAMFLIISISNKILKLLSRAYD